jgi:hypothetical protein
MLPLPGPLLAACQSLWVICPASKQARSPTPNFQLEPHNLNHPSITKRNSATRMVLSFPKRPIGYSCSYLACRIGHWDPIWQPSTGSSLQ